MISEKLANAINNQINREIYSAYLYLSMASYFDSKGLKGCSNWMKVQCQEEMMHAMKMYDYLYKRNARVVLLPIEAPPVEWASQLEVFKSTLEHEKKVTGIIKSIYEIAKEEDDVDAKNFLDWYLKEQEEEEESASDKVQKFLMTRGDDAKINELDAELAKRVFH